MTRRILAIDPGAKGAIAFGSVEYGVVYEVEVVRMPETQADLWEWLRRTLYDTDAAYIENVGGYRPGNSGPAAVKFARQVERCEMALTCLYISWERVAPSKWMKYVLGTVPPDKKERKHAIKEAMQRRYPHLPITLDNADALGIFTWAAGQVK